MIAPAPPIPDRLNARRQALGMSHAALAQRSGVSEPTVKRILSDRAPNASFASVTSIAQALGMSLDLAEQDPDELCRQQARRKAEHIARMVQGTSALENQAVDDRTYRRLVERSYHELLAGPRRRLWAP
jgi:transcriptional regulator with XRE-family HTH domain